jgi:proteasome lid subunit RPN8/RPN11
MAIVAHARRDAPNECCGLLIGQVGTAQSDPHVLESGPHVLEAVPASNAASDPTRRYEISPVDYFAQIKRCRRISDAQSGNFEVLGAYHSHPRGGPDPSETDTAQAFRDFVFVIVGLAGAAGGMEIRAYRFEDERLNPVELIVVDAQA